MSRFLVGGLFVMLATGVAIAGSINVYNSDSKVHTIDLNCGGSKKSITIKGSTTTTYTFHSTHKECEIVGGTITFPVKKLENNQKWKIKDGKATKN